MNLDDLNKQKKEYEILISVFGEITDLSSAQYDTIKRLEKDFYNKILQIDKQIAEQEIFDRNIQKKYKSMRKLLLFFSLITFIILCLSIISVDINILIFISLLFLAIQYMALFFSGLRVKNKNLYIFSLLLVFIPFIIVGIQAIYPNVNTEWFSLTLQGMSLYNFAMGLHSRMQ